MASQDSSHFRQDFAREQLESGDGLLIEHLEEHTLNPHLLPGLEVTA